MKAAGWFVAALVACIAIALHLRQDEANRAVVAAIAHRADSLDVGIVALRDSVAQQKVADSLERGKREAVIATLRHDLTTIQSRTDTLLDTLTVADSTQLGIIRTQFRNERAAAQAVIAAQDSTIRWMDGRIRYWRDTAMTAKDQQLAVSQRLLHEALAAKRPGRFACVVGGGVTVGRGQAVGASLACGLRL